MSFTAAQTRKLRAKLDRGRIKSRERSGREVPYVEGWFAIAEANRIFGFEGWDRLTLSHQLLFERQEAGRTYCAYLARVRVIVRAGGTVVVREGSGFGSADDPDPAQAFELALKAAETDATKRALATFGNRFGLALYDKDQVGVGGHKGGNGSSEGPGGKPLDGPRAPSGPLPSVHQSPSSATAGAELPCSVAHAPGNGQTRPLLPPVDGAGSDRARASAATPVGSPAKPHAPADAPPRAKSDPGLLPGVATMQARWVGLDRSGLRATLSEAGDNPTPPGVEGTNADASQRAAASIKNALVFFKHLRLRLLRTSTLAGVEHLMAGVADEIERLKQHHPDLRNARGLHHADVIRSIADLRRAELSGHDRPPSVPPGVHTRIEKSKLALATAKRHRDAHHLKSVAALPCLVCARQPAHAHHLTFAQPRGLSLKVSDEYAVPFCAIHHDALHRSGNERRWWQGHNLDPLPVAQTLWQRSRGLDVAYASEITAPSPQPSAAAPETSTSSEERSSP